MDEYEEKMRESAKSRELIAKEINRLLSEYKELERQELQWEDEEFARTGSFTETFGITITITEQDLLQDLVSRTEGKNISPDKPNLN